MPTTFNTAEVEAAITTTRFRDALHHLQVTHSTNDLAHEAAQSGTKTGVWVADEQTAGRGRGGHTWLSQPGDGLYMSVLVHLAIPLQTATYLPLITGFAVQSAILQQTGLQLDIRWPNDLMFDDRKCGGILVESTSGPGATLKYAVIGIGLNLNHTAFPPSLASVATSLRIESGQTFRREPVLAAILYALDGELTHLESEATLQLASKRIAQRFTAASTWANGKRVRVGANEDGQGGYTGWTRGLDPNGFLLVESDSGELHTIHSGGVRSA